VGGEVGVAELKPGRAAEAGDGGVGAEGLVGEAPAAVEGGEAGEGVHDRVEVGGDVEAPVGEVVAGVDDEGEGVGRDHLGEAVGEARAADAAAEGDHAAGGGGAGAHA
jgi:hypothetical protein